MSERTKRWAYLAGIGLGIIIVTAFVFSQLIFPVILGRTPKVDTPNIVGMSLRQAKNTMEKAKLHLVVKDSLYNENAAVEAVLEQDPEPGKTIRQDGTVYVVISKGSSTVTIPSVIGKSFQEAIVTLRNKDLRYAVADSAFSDSYPINSVIQSIPHSGNKVEKRTMVKLILSRGAPAASDTTNLDQPVYPENSYGY